MNQHERPESTYFSIEDVIGGGNYPSIESYNPHFSFSEINTRNYESHIEPNQPCYQSLPLELPDPNAQFIQSMSNQDFQYQNPIKRKFDSFVKLHTKSEFTSTDCHAQGSNKGGSLQPKANAVFASRNIDMEKFVSTSWRELAGTEHRENYGTLNSWAESKEVRNIVPSGGGPETAKQRIRWTHELHEQFMEAVNSLGGAMKATPKGILRLMRSQGLTIFHIKSHLQKYRTVKCIPNHPEGRIGRRTSSDGVQVSELNGNGSHMLEALRLQMDVQKSLHEHLEFQKRLQMRIEEHANYLQKMFDQQNISSGFYGSYNPDVVLNQYVTECSSTGGFAVRDEKATSKPNTR